jgi:hypothetical protein
MKPNNIKPGIAKYTHLKYQYQRDGQDKPKPQPRYGQPKFPYTYNKNARVSFLDQVQVIQYKEVEPPTPRKVPIPYKLLSEIQLLRTLVGLS